MYKRQVPEDRYQRFGLRMSDEALWRWAQDLPLVSHRWWGAWLPPATSGDHLLAGVLQLTPTTIPACCELALSVLAPVRRSGIATRLLETALTEAPALRQLVCHHGHTAVHAMAVPLGLEAQRAMDGSLRLVLPRQRSSSSQPPGPGASRGHSLA